MKDQTNKSSYDERSMYDEAQRLVEATCRDLTSAIGEIRAGLLTIGNGQRYQILTRPELRVVSE
jgi:hypothetical protein